MDIRIAAYDSASGLDTLILPLAADSAPALPEPFTGLAATPGLAEASSKHKETAFLYAPEGSPCRRLAAVGLGEAKELDAARLRQAVAAGARLARERKTARLGVSLAGLPTVPGVADEAALVREAALAVRLALYSFRELKTEGEVPVDPEEVLLLTNGSGEELSAALALAEAEAAGMLMARTLVNRPSNLASPDALAETAREIAERHGFFCQVLGRAEIEDLGMGAFAAVAQGSRSDPRFIVVDTDPKSAAAPLVLVGKGVTFDTGGISLKPSAGMEEMKSDMAGAAAVLGCLEAMGMLGRAAGLCRVVGLLPCTDNMPDGGSVKPGDVVRTLSGLTVEIVNTDAEGRLLLCDALAYAKRFSPERIIDLATLTGACRIALGVHYAGVFSADEALAARIRETGATLGDKFWPLPLDEAFAKELESETADLKNVGRREGGAITAAMFLKRFVPEGASWAHLDIAPTAFADAASELCPKGGTGFGVRTLLALARE
ncbi:cytosol aminopeptidase [Desulfovibrio sp. X2]|uniref:leucyl aminopeptidase n=1 Tax=Desulfovibrio sp. X2 TaxID=941449 RepID=UPI000358E9DB|nr:leucyl aminopeptidase [Desulfovibrio sp. X2]EPR44705.1 cytosol aminopeptidase [Desulfovibrio sp. X2]